MITDFTGGTANARPNIICDPVRGASGSDLTGSAYVINTSCFTAPTALGQIGNNPRNSVRIPSIFNNDLAVFKNFKIGESRGVQLRWEMYNIFNHTQWSGVDNNARFDAAGNQVNGQFGQVTSARLERQMQFALRFEF